MSKAVSPSPAAAVPALAAPAIAAPKAAAPAPGRLHIGELALTMSGVQPAAAKRIAERATALAAERLPHGLGGQLDQLSLDVRPRGFSEHEWSEAVARALVEAIRARSGERA
jgi:hypothetical protein